MADVHDVWSSWRERPLLDELPEPDAEGVGEAAAGDGAQGADEDDSTDVVALDDLLAGQDAAPQWPLDGEGLDEAEMRLLRYRAADWAQRNDQSDDASPPRRRGDLIRRVRGERDRRGRAARAVLPDADDVESGAEPSTAEAKSPMPAEAEDVTKTMTDHPSSPEVAPPPPPPPPPESRSLSRPPIPPPPIPPRQAPVEDKTISLPDIPSLFSESAAPTGTVEPDPESDPPVGPVIDEWLEGLLSQPAFVEPPPPPPLSTRSAGLSPSAGFEPTPTSDADAAKLDAREAARRRALAAARTTAPPPPPPPDPAQRVAPAVSAPPPPPDPAQRVAPAASAPPPPPAAPAPPAPAPATSAPAAPAPPARSTTRHVTASAASGAAAAGPERDQAPPPDTVVRPNSASATSSPPRPAAEVASRDHERPAAAARPVRHADVDVDDGPQPTPISAGEVVLVVSPRSASLAERLELATLAERLGQLTGASVEVAVEQPAPLEPEGADLPAGWTRAPAPDEGDAASGWTTVAADADPTGGDPTGGAPLRPGDHTGAGRQFERKRDEPDHADHRRAHGPRLPAT